MRDEVAAVGVGAHLGGLVARIVFVGEVDLVAVLVADARTPPRRRRTRGVDGVEQAVAECHALAAEAAGRGGERVQGDQRVAAALQRRHFVEHLGGERGGVLHLRRREAEAEGLRHLRLAAEVGALPGDELDVPALDVPEAAQFVDRGGGARGVLAVGAEDLRGLVGRDALDVELAEPRQRVERLAFERGELLRELVRVRQQRTFGAAGIGPCAAWLRGPIRGMGDSMSRSTPRSASLGRPL